ncbi:MAG: LuxR family transcriptional regulator [Paraprevotella sp.]|nr:LuxR family transcriptional regulator [Paraprevotella sp.]
MKKDIIGLTEFYNTPQGDVMVKRAGEPVAMLTVENRPLVSELLSVISDRYPDAFRRLAEAYSRYEPNRCHYEFKMVHRFCRCNFGEYDEYKRDIDENGTCFFEEVRCPLRGECRDEGVICKPQLRTELTGRENEILELIGEGLQAQEIAEELCISVPTVNRHRENIKARLGLRTIGQLVKYYHENVKI